MRTVPSNALLFFAAFALCAFTVPSDTLLTSANMERTARKFDEMLSTVSSPEFDALVARHHAVVQHGYANVLLDELNQDSLSAIISFLKYRLYKTFSLPTTQLVKVIPLPEQEVSAPIILNYTNGFIVIDWKQDKTYRRVVDDNSDNPWEKNVK